MVEIGMKKKNKRHTIAKNLLKLTIVAALTPLIYVGGELVFGRSWDKQSLLNEHEKIEYLRANMKKENLTPEQKAEYQKAFRKTVVSHVDYQLTPFKGKLYEFFPYTPKCPWCEQLRSENQR